MKKDIKRTIKELKEYRYNMLREMDSIDHVLECSLQNYDFMIDFAIKKGFDTVVDIGCAYGHQSELCKDRIKYVGIDEDEVNFYKEILHKDYIIGKYPFYIPSFYYDSLAISNLAIGWQCYVNEKEFEEQCKALSKDFKACLLYLPVDREKTLKKYFKNIEIFKKDKNKPRIIRTAFYYCYN